MGNAMAINKLIMTPVLPLLLASSERQEPVPLQGTFSALASGCGRKATLSLRPCGHLFLVFNERAGRHPAPALP